MNAGTAVARTAPQASTLPSSPLYTSMALIVTDSLALLLAVALSVGLKFLVQGDLTFGAYLRLWPFLFVFLGVFAAIGLYSGVGMGAPEEMRRATLASSILFLCLAAVTVSLRGAQHNFTWTLFLALLLSVGLIPLARECTRLLFAGRDWWGYPAVIFGAGKCGEGAAQAMLADPGLGLKPIAFIDDHSFRVSVCGLPVYRNLDPAVLLPDRRKNAYAVFAMPDVADDALEDLVERCGETFSHVLAIPQFSNFASLWIRPRSVGGMLGLEMRQQALQRNALIVKRFVDILFCVVGGLFVLPIVAALIVAMKVTSPGPVFYGQRRIGQRGKRFTAWKFRSMVLNADQVLEEYLVKDPALFEEWTRDHKLRNDPRVTGVGRFLRKTSLDELPQLWNVFTGDMSLVGPRPIVDQEVARYGRNFGLYTRVKGGITGLWQVSGRNNTTYEERVNLDSFYVRNWSVWLDFCILFRTIAVVLFGDGAY
jgi:Undecaprenyl-phosphate galactose phosphotransferase WbaP